MPRARIKPSRGPAGIGVIAGIITVVFTIAFLTEGLGLLVPPVVLGEVALTICWVVLFYSRRMPAYLEIEVGEEGEGLREKELPFDGRLRRLERLRAERLITEEEYPRKRERILRGEW